MDDNLNFFQNEFKFFSEPVLVNNVDVVNNDWYYENFTRIEAEKLLLHKSDGCFLVRKSVQGNFSLSIKYGDKVLHFKIFEDTRGKFSLWKVKFNSLVELIEYYRESSISNSNDVRLMHTPGIKNTQLVVGKYDFNSQKEGDLSFKRGDIIHVMSQIDENWWQGAIGARQGIFPSTYVTSDTENDP